MNDSPRFQRRHIPIWQTSLNSSPSWSRSRSFETRAADMVGEAAFALLYFQRATDLIPDSIPGMGLLDDAMIVRIVLGRHEHAFKSSSHALQAKLASSELRRRSTALSCLATSAELVLLVDGDPATVV